MIKIKIIIIISVLACYRPLAVGKHLNKEIELFYLDKLGPLAFSHQNYFGTYIDSW
jgi:hypothetical protein